MSAFELSEVTPALAQRLQDTYESCVSLGIDPAAPKLCGDCRQKLMGRHRALGGKAIVSRASMAKLMGKKLGTQRSRWHREEIGAAIAWVVILMATVGGIVFGGNYAVESYGVADVATDTTYADKLFAYIVPITVGDSVFAVDTLGVKVDSFPIRRPDPDSVPITSCFRAVYGTDSVIVLSYDTLALAVLDSAVVDSFYTAWSLDGPPAYEVTMPSSCVPAAPPSSSNAPVFEEDFESWTTTTWRHIDNAGKNPYNLIGDTLDQSIQTSGSAEGNNHLLMFRTAKSSAGPGCQNNSIGFQIETGGTPSYRFGAIMGSSKEFWFEFWVKFDTGAAPWGTLPDTAWSCTGNPDHKLWRFYVNHPFGGPQAYWALKDGKSTNLLWAVTSPPKGDGTPQSDKNAGTSSFWWDNTWHLVRVHGKRSSSQGVADGIAQFTIDSAGTRIILNKTGRSTPVHIPYDAVDIWWTSWSHGQFGLNRNHWTNHDAQFRFDHIRIWTPVSGGGNGPPNWIGETLVDP